MAYFPTARAAGERTPWRTWDVVNTPLTPFSSKPFPNSIDLRRGRTGRLRPKWFPLSGGNKLMKAWRCLHHQPEQQPLFYGSRRYDESCPSASALVGFKAAPPPAPAVSIPSSHQRHSHNQQRPEPPARGAISTTKFVPSWHNYNRVRKITSAQH